MKKLSIITAILLCSDLGLASPPSTAGLSKRQTVAYKQLVEALAKAPNNPRLLSELSALELEREDFERAKSYGERSVNFAKQTKQTALEAASLYNIGRACEGLNDFAGAKSAYKESLALRKNDVVEQRLNTLDQRDPKIPYKAAPLEGPFSTLEAWCKRREKEEAGIEHTDEHVGCLDNLNENFTLTIPDAMPRVYPPIKALRLFGRTVPEYSGSGSGLLYLGIKTTRGWYVSSDIAAIYYRVSGAINEIKVRNIQSVPGKPIVSLVVEQIYIGSNRTNKVARLVVIGVGPSSVPSQIDPIDVRNHEGDISKTEDGIESEKTVKDWSVDISVEPNQTLRVNRPKQKIPSEVSLPPTGKPLEFP